MKRKYQQKNRNNYLQSRHDNLPSNRIHTVIALPVLWILMVPKAFGNSAAYRQTFSIDQIQCPLLVFNNRQLYVGSSKFRESCRRVLGHANCIPWLPHQKKWGSVYLCMTLNCTWWLSSSFGALGSMEYDFKAITPRSNLIRSSSICSTYGLICLKLFDFYSTT